MTHLSIIIYFNHNFLTMENNNKQDKPIRWKYSDMMRWMDEMHREVGLTIPPKKPEQQPEKDTSIAVIFIKRRK